jgi:hypothetical protein
MDFTKYDVFTIPSIYQLLPHEGILRAFDEDLKEIEVDIYDSETWKKYGWLVYDSAEFRKEFSAEEQNFAEEYFKTVLNRGKLFQAALNAGSTATTSVRIYNFGAECMDTVDGMVVYKDRKTNDWRTLFETQSFKKSDGTTVSKKQVKKTITSPGDGQVSGTSLNHGFTKSTGPEGEVRAQTIVCGYHTFLVGDKEIRKSILNVLNLPLSVSAK